MRGDGSLDGVVSAVPVVTTSTGNFLPYCLINKAWYAGCEMATQRLCGRMTAARTLQR